MPDNKGATNDLPAKLRDIGRWAVEAKGVEVVYEAADEIERLRWALQKFGGHLRGCTKLTEQLSEYACSCGFTKAVRGGR